jgi:hypothetical protein
MLTQTMNINPTAARQFITSTLANASFLSIPEGLSKTGRVSRVGSHGLALVRTDISILPHHHHITTYLLY